MPETIDQFRGEHAFLSNFFVVDGGVKIIAYRTLLWAPTTEHLFQALKSDQEIDHRMVCSAATAREAKARGRRVSLRPDWDQVRDHAMDLCLEAKFGPAHPELAWRLLDTDDALLVEGNSWGDRYWGVDLKTGVGSNHLGLALMRLRQRLRDDLQGEI